MPTLSDLPIRIRAKIQPNADNGCWEWTGWLDRYGYGRTTFRRRKWLVHRLVYEFAVGPIPEGLVLDHVKERCRNRHCCNPEHLEPVTVGENVRRAVETTHCPKGHDYSVHGRTGRRSSGKKFKHCLICYNDWRRKWRARQRQ